MSLLPGYYIDHYNDIAIRHPDGAWDIFSGAPHLFGYEFMTDTALPFRDYQAENHKWEYIAPLDFTTGDNDEL